MNLFILDKCPFKAAEYYQDLHVNKIIIEGSQLLASAYSLERLAKNDCPRTQKGKPRVHGHKNHPVSLWTRENMSNFMWVLNHLNALYQERVYRFNKSHFTKEFIDWCSKNSPVLKDSPLTEHPQCFKVSYPECIVPNDPVKGYHNYYNKAKMEFKFGSKIVKANWTKREIPYFIKK